MGSLTHSRKTSCFSPRSFAHIDMSFNMRMEWFPMSIMGISCQNLKKETVKYNLTRFNETIIKKLKSFDPTKEQNPQSAVNDLITEAQKLYESIYVDLILPLQASYNEKHLNNSLSEFHTKAKEQLNEMEKLKVDFKQSSEEQKKTLENLRNDSGTTGVAMHAQIFEKQAKAHRNASGLWGSAAGIVICFLATVLWFLYVELGKPANIPKDYHVLIQMLAIRLFFLSFISIVLYQILRIFFAEMHLMTVNQHRENSLRTFQTFVGAAGDKVTRDTVLLQATKTIFETGQTGFLSFKDTTVIGIDTATKIIEQFKGG